MTGPFNAPDPLLHASHICDRETSICLLLALFSQYSDVVPGHVFVSTDQNRHIHLCFRFWFPQPHLRIRRLPPGSRAHLIDPDPITLEQELLFVYWCLYVDRSILRAEAQEVVAVVTSVTVIVRSTRSGSCRRICHRHICHTQLTTTHSLRSGHEREDLYNVLLVGSVR